MTARYEQRPIVLLPPAQLRLPAAEQMIPIREVDWVRIRTRVSRISDPRPVLNNMAWTFFGIAMSASLAYFPWLAAYDALEADAQDRFLWVSVVLVAVGVGALVIAVVCGITSRLLRKAVEVTTTAVCDEMDAIYCPGAGRKRRSSRRSSRGGRRRSRR
jgi:hypothetical protein